MCVCVFVCTYVSLQLTWRYTHTHDSVCRLETDDHMFSLYHFPPSFFEKGSLIGLEAHDFSSTCWSENPWDLSFSTTSTGALDTPSFSKEKKTKLYTVFWGSELRPSNPNSFSHWLAILFTLFSPWP